MKKMILVLFSCLFLTLPCYPQELSGFVKVSRIIDGDTVEIQLKETTAKVRLAGIDCFETSKIHRAYKQAYLNQISIDEVILKGCEAKCHLQHLIDAQNIKVEIVGIDKYGRLLGIFYDKNNLNINQTLINRGICPKYVYKN